VEEVLEGRGVHVAAALWSSMVSASVGAGGEAGRARSSPCLAWRSTNYTTRMSSPGTSPTCRTMLSRRPSPRVSLDVMSLLLAPVLALVLAGIVGMVGIAGSWLGRTSGRVSPEDVAPREREGWRLYH
jgi:hypothetical protein